MFEDEDIEILFKNSFASFEEIPPRVVKDAVDKNLFLNTNPFDLFVVLSSLFLISLGIIINLSKQHDELKKTHLTSETNILYNSTKRTKGNKFCSSNVKNSQLSSVNTVFFSKSRFRNALTSYSDSVDLFAKPIITSPESSFNIESNIFNSTQLIPGKSSPTGIDIKACPNVGCFIGNQSVNRDHSNWYASVGFGCLFKQKIESHDSLQSYNTNTNALFSIDLMRWINPKFGLASGLGFSSYNETVSDNIYSIDSTLSGFNTIPIYSDPNNPTNVTGYDTVYLYQYESVKSSLKHTNQIRSVLLPVYAFGSKRINDKLNLQLYAGFLMKVNLPSGTVSNVVNTNYSRIRIVPSVRMSLNYLIFKDLNLDFGITGNLRMLHDFNYLNLRKRSFSLAPTIRFIF